MVDAIDSKSVIRKGVRVQVPSPVNEAGQVKACPALRLHGFFVVGFSKKMENSTIIVEITEKNCKSDDGHPGGGRQVPSPFSSGEGKSRLVHLTISPAMLVAWQFLWSIHLSANSYIVTSPFMQ